MVVVKMQELVSDEDLAAETTDGQDESSEKTYDADADDEDDGVDDAFRDEDCEVKGDGGHLLILDSAESRCRRKKRGRNFGSGRSRVLPDCGCGSLMSWQVPVARAASSQEGAHHGGRIGSNSDHHSCYRSIAQCA